MSVETTADCKYPTRGTLDAFSTWKCPCQRRPIIWHRLQICATHGTESKTWRLIGPDQVLSKWSALWGAEILPKHSMSLRPPRSRTQRGRDTRENNQHLCWEQSTAQRVRREWSGTSAGDSLQTITASRGERSDASGCRGILRNNSNIKIST